MNVPADEVFVGMKVQVVFEHTEDVWVPLFEPTGETDKGPFPADDPPSTTPARCRRRATSSRTRSRSPGSDSRASGGGSCVDPVVLAVEAAEHAIADAGLTRDDIDGLTTYPGGMFGGGMSEGGIYALEEALRLRPSWINGGLETPGRAAR